MHTLTTERQTNGFIPVRLDAPQLLSKQEGRREGHFLSALLVGVLLVSEVNWWDNTLSPFKAVSWAVSHHLPYRRARRAFNNLVEKHLATLNLHPFRPGSLQVTSRDNEGSLLHDQARKHEHFVPISRLGLTQILKEHSLSWSATAMLLLLLFLCDHHNAKLPDGWTKAKLSDQFGIGWRTLTAFLEALESAGLITFNATRGKDLTLELLARSALVEPCAPTPMQRGPKRKLLNEKMHKRGPASELAMKIINYYKLSVTPSSTFVHVIGETLATGASESQVLDQLIARGSLNGARDPVAVLVTRMRSITESFILSQKSRDEMKRQLEAEALEQRATEEHIANENERYQGENRWLAQNVSTLPTPKDLGLDSDLTARPVFVAARLHEIARQVVGDYPDLDPKELILQLEKNKFVAIGLNVEQVTQRKGVEFPPGTLPTLRAGPTLLERFLRPTHS